MDSKGGKDGTSVAGSVKGSGGVNGGKSSLSVGGGGVAGNPGREGTSAEPGSVPELESLPSGGRAGAFGSKPGSDVVGAKSIGSELVVVAGGETGGTVRSGNGSSPPSPTSGSVGSGITTGVGGATLGIAGAGAERSINVPSERQVISLPCLNPSV